MNHSQRIPGFNDLIDQDLQVDIAGIEESVIIISLKGYIDTYNTLFLSKKINMVINNGYERIVFLMSDILYVSSSGIGIFTAFLKQLRSLKGDLVLVDIQPKVMEIFELIGFTNFMKFSPDVASAVNRIKPESASEKNADKKFVPKVFKCSCLKKLQASRPGNFRCPQCKKIISVDAIGSVTIV